MRITVAICTWNRAKLLDQTLTQMQQLCIPANVEWELLIVNNNCTDETDAIIAQHEGALPIRRLFEPNPGHSHARNCATEAAEGDLIVWTDDDVLVDELWLAEYARAAEAWPNAGYFGGTIEPWFETPAPEWIKQNMDLLAGPFVILQLGGFVGRLPEGYMPFGANMAFRRDYMSGRPFDTRLGYCKGKMIGGDETTLIGRLQRQGVEGVWVGSARVRHFIPASRATSRFFWEWFAGFGQSEIRIADHVPRRYVAGMPLWAVRLCVVHSLAAVLVAPISARRWLKHYSKAAEGFGVMREFRGRAKRRASNETVLQPTLQS
jgi:glucosyl-dolichyl phosphate glucuronosyltransferase